MKSPHTVEGHLPSTEGKKDLPSGNSTPKNTSYGQDSRTRDGSSVQKSQVTRCKHRGSRRNDHIGKSKSRYSWQLKAPVTGCDVWKQKRSGGKRWERPNPAELLCVLVLETPQRPVHTVQRRGAPRNSQGSHEKEQTVRSTQRPEGKKIVPKIRD